ncbi:choice-of-anchor Q domain-containing protein [Chloroflexus sp.]|uniref:beta strand repeat-containing protein n=1 Tax=Chloroflexus sp. TaxID=1904827 RepID=UPI002ADD5CE0|nr:choice-of-anchor Q domain-containing protein [Chloroflexus sp.]
MTITRFPRTPALLIVMALIAGGIPVRPMHAAGFVVNSLGDTAMPTAGDGFCTLREAIASANNAGNGDCGPDSAADDTITFNVSGTITLASVLPPIASGAGALTIDGGGNITISGDGSEQVLLINPGTNLTLQSLTITNGDSFGFGSGIQNSGTLTVTNSVLSNNAAGYGAGIDNTGTLTITNSIFSNNAATTSSGILNAGTLTITNSSFSNNAATTSSSGIYNAGTLTITNSLLSNNTADYSAGVFNGTADTLTITNSRLANNIASDSSGGIANSGTLTVTNSTFSTNQAGTLDGGGVYNQGALIIANSVLSSNAATTSGGGIANSGTLTVTNSTFSNNGAPNGGGIHSTGTLTLNNTIIANSFVGDCRGSVASADHNLIENTGTDACNLTNGVNGNIIGQDPNLGILTGTPAYFSLNTGSPAIDKGSNAICAAAPVNNQSQNGVTRPQDGNDDSSATCDIGSYELDVTPPTVTSITRADPNPTNATSVNFTVTFSESVTGVDSSDFSLNPTGGVSGASITGVSGFGSSYTVTVNTGTGSGTLRLDIPATWSRRRRTQSIGTSRQRDATSGYSCNGHDYRPDR